MKELIYLIGCAVNNIDADPKICKNFNFEKCYKFASLHNISPLIYHAIKKLNFIDITKWHSDYINNTRRNILFDTEKDKICKFLIDNKIWFVLLKGTVIQNYYPVFGMRQMVDIDILFDWSFEKNVTDYFLQNNYIYKKEFRHNCYKKPPVYNFEMHEVLFQTDPPKIFYEYFKQITKHLKNKSTKNTYEKIMPDLYIYIFQIAHDFKHNIRIGIGLKRLIDIYILFKNLNLDKNELSKELKKIKLYKYEKKYRNLALKLFSKPNMHFNLNKEETKILNSFFDLKSYQLSKSYFSQKIKYFWLFPLENLKYYLPSCKLMENKHHIIVKHKAFLPIYWAKLYKQKLITFLYKSNK